MKAVFVCILAALLLVVGHAWTSRGSFPLRRASLPGATAKQTSLNGLYCGSARRAVSLRCEAIDADYTEDEEDAKKRKKSAALDLLDVLTCTNDEDSIEYDVKKDIRRDNLLQANDYNSLKIALRQKGLRTVGDKLEMIARLLLHEIDPSVDYRELTGRESNLKFVDEEDIASNKVRLVPESERNTYANPAPSPSPAEPVSSSTAKVKTSTHTGTTDTSTNTEQQNEGNEEDDLINVIESDERRFKPTEGSSNGTSRFSYAKVDADEVKLSQGFEDRDLDSIYALQEESLIDAEDLAVLRPRSRSGNNGRGNSNSIASSANNVVGGREEQDQFSTTGSGQGFEGGQVMMDGLTRQVQSIPPMQFRRGEEEVQEQDQGKGDISAYVVGGRDVLRTWERNPTVVVLLPDEYVSVSESESEGSDINSIRAGGVAGSGISGISGGWQDPHTRVLADELAFAMQAIVVVPDLTRGLGYLQGKPSSEKASNRTGGEVSLEMHARTMDDILSVLAFSRMSFDAQALTIAGVGVGGGLALETCCDSYDTACLLAMERGGTSATQMQELVDLVSIERGTNSGLRAEGEEDFFSVNSDGSTGSGITGSGSGVEMVDFAFKGRVRSRAAQDPSDSGSDDVMNAADLDEKALEVMMESMLANLDREEAAGEWGGSSSSSSSDSDSDSDNDDSQVKPLGGGVASVEGEAEEVVEEVEGRASDVFGDLDIDSDTDSSGSRSGNWGKAVDAAEPEPTDEAIRAAIDRAGEEEGDTGKIDKSKMDKNQRLEQQRIKEEVVASAVRKADVRGAVRAFSGQYLQPFALGLSQLGDADIAEEWQNPSSSSVYKNEDQNEDEGGEGHTYTGERWKGLHRRHAGLVGLVPRAVLVFDPVYTSASDSVSTSINKDTNEDGDENEGGGREGFGVGQNKVHTSLRVPSFFTFSSDNNNKKQEEEEETLVRQRVGGLVAHLSAIPRVHSIVDFSARLYEAYMPPRLRTNSDAQTEGGGGGGGGGGGEGKKSFLLQPRTAHQALCRQEAVMIGSTWLDVYARSMTNREEGQAGAADVNVKKVKPSGKAEQLEAGAERREGYDANSRASFGYYHTSPGVALTKYSQPFSRICAEDIGGEEGGGIEEYDIMNAPGTVATHLHEKL